MNLKTKSNSELISETLTRREREKEFVAEFLHYLKEIEERGLHLEYGFSSMYGFCTEFLGYSKDEAHVRIQAMRLLRALPETEGKIRAGSLTLSSAAKIQGAFKREDQKRRSEKRSTLSHKEKKEVVLALETQSSRECERALVEIFPDSQRAVEKTKPIANEQTVIQFVADHELMQNFARLKELLAHKNFGGRWDLLFKELAKIGLDKLAPERKRPRTSKAKERSNGEVPETPSERQPESQTQTPAPALHTPPLGTPRGTKRHYISIHTRCEVQRKAGYACEYVDPLTGKRCGSKHAMEIDHIHPLALGGGDEPENLRLLCAQHNKYLASQIWGSGFRSACPDQRSTL